MTLSYPVPRVDTCDTCPLNSRRLCREVMKFTDHDGPQQMRRLRSVKAETRLQEENEGPAITGILRKGYLRTERILMDGRRSVLSFLVPGDLIGDPIGSARVPALIAATDAEICVLDPVAMGRAMHSDAGLKSQILAEACRQHTRQLEMIWRRGALNSRERIVAFIVLAAEFMPVEPLPDGGIVLSVRVSRKDWADFANTTVETISRTLTYLSEKDMVQTVAPGRFHVRDLGALAKLAGLDCHEDRAAMVCGEHHGNRAADAVTRSPAAMALRQRDASTAFRRH